MMSETVGQGYAICRYSREDAAQGNVSIAVTGTTNFGRLENLRNSSGDNGMFKMHLLTITNCWILSLL